MTKNVIFVVSILMSGFVNNYAMQQDPVLKNAVIWGGFIASGCAFKLVEQIINNQCQGQCGAYGAAVILWSGLAISYRCASRFAPHQGYHMQLPAMQLPSRSQALEACRDGARALVCAASAIKRL